MNDKPGKNESPPDVVMVAYQMKVAAEHMRQADKYLGHAYECLGIVRDREVAEGEGKIGTRNMDFAFLFADLNELRGMMFRIGDVQQAQCSFNRTELRNKIVTNEQLEEFGGGGGR